MPRTSKPTLPEPQLISDLQSNIAISGWATVRSQIVEQYEQRLHKLQQSGLTSDEISKKRTKKLSRNELISLALCFLAHLVELSQQKQDTEDTIRQLCEAETALLEGGYPAATIAKNHHPLYINLIRDAIARKELILNQQNSYLLPVPDRDTGELSDVRIHYAQLYLKYDNPFYVSLKRSTTTNNNLKQDHPQPVILPQYSDKARELLNSKSYPELATGIAAASGRRFSELIRGRFSLPSPADSPYQFIFEGQLKKKDKAPAYSTYSLVPAEELIKAIARLRAFPKIKPLSSASIRQINDSMNAAVNYQVQRHFQDTNIVSVLHGESRVTIQNLRGVYGEIATHFFCPNRAAFPRFLSSCLGHLIGDEAIANSNSPSTQHYFHYYLVDVEGKQIDSMGVMLDKEVSQPPTTEIKSDQQEQPTTTAPKPKRTILHLYASTKERFQTFRGKDMSENDAVIALMDKAEQAQELERELNDARARISSLEAKLDSIEEQRDSVEVTEESASVDDAAPTPGSNLVSSDEKSLELENPTDTVLLLVKSMSQLTNKLDLLLERQFTSSNSSSSDVTVPQAPDKQSLDQQSSDQQSSDQQSPDDKQLPTEAILNRAIDTIMAHNNRAKSPDDKWYIGINPLKDIINSQVTIVRVVKRRKAEIDQHHQQHNLDKFHNRNYHREQSYTDFFDFS
ncbi:protelomerase family protein [Myxosarcina sp. GI1]|uniref:protelomerase family protein n=1 Tax=Myxosarcina sp. GI1 TaxID=1541065 RepID=UPI000689D32E|nr:protelomerase family protein [Myxosarcina sp. GI1]